MDTGMNTGLITGENSVLLAVDYQEKLMPHIHGAGALLRKAALLLESAGILGVPVVLTEQYPKGLGKTVPEVAKLAVNSPPVEKTCFSCAGEPEFMRRFGSVARKQVVIMGVETHVCVAQTAVELAARGFQVFVAADACGSRRLEDAGLGLRRMESAGVVVTGAEAVVFEWLRRAGTEEFKRISALVKAAW